MLNLWSYFLPLEGKRQEGLVLEEGVYRENIHIFFFMVLNPSISMCLGGWIELSCFVEDPVGEIDDKYRNSRI